MLFLGAATQASTANNDGDDDGDNDDDEEATNAALFAPIGRFSVCFLVDGGHPFCRNLECSLFDSVQQGTTLSTKRAGIPRHVTARRECATLLINLGM